MVTSLKPQRCKKQTLNIKSGWASITFDTSVCQTKYTGIKETWRKAMGFEGNIIPMFECCPNVHMQVFYDLAWTHSRTFLLFRTGRNKVRCMKVGIVTTATRPDDLSSILRTRMEEGKNKLLFESLSDLTHSYPTAQTNKFNFKKF